MKRIVTAALLVWSTGPVVGASPAEIEERIQRVQRGIVPPVLVSGETPLMRSLAERMSEDKVPGVSIAVIHDGRIEWARGFGVTHSGGAPVTDNTLFQAASISKPVFALGVLRLVDAGKLNLDANVNDYLKTWKLPENDLTRQSRVTLRGILSHTAGLTVHGFPGYAAKAPVPTTLQVLEGTPPANTAAIRVDILPGSRFRYSGGGYVLAQQLLSDVAGIPLPKLMRDSVLAPLGMSRSTFEQPLPATRAAEVAMPHKPDGSQLEGGPHTYPEMAAAGLWTTPTDLGRYALGVQAAFAGKSRRVISADTARVMLTPVIHSQGLGLMTDGATSRKYFMHGGANEGYRCLLVAYTDGEGAIVMTNSDSGDGIMGDLMRTIAHVYQWPDFAPPLRTLSKIRPELLDRYVGAYDLDDGSAYVVRKNGDGLIGQAIGYSPHALFPSSDVEFFAKDVDAVVTFALDAKGAAQSIRHQLGGWQVRTGPRVDEARARQLVATVERIAQRFKDQTPRPESESAIRQLLGGLASGKPEYDRMMPKFAELARQELPRWQQFLGSLGALRSVGFYRVSEEGGDDYDADFENGKLRLRVQLSDDGRIDSVQFQPR